ncbi:hypothetical protein SAMN05443633_102354 [Chryseobacterium arachidis]|uniref:Tetratricopeptide repeat-containing protein n=1 Tax=Chryseobacterium arachidis TaxID=1416778 RepID=A0A1M4XKX8_9FLAO|nr:hypothetical protein [Chryseobacterium arachidis]SHE93903.1 hypothetical protein SAMN05443633_102354 [Chryseobacterium arachidis]
MIKKLFIFFSLGMGVYSFAQTSYEKTLPAQITKLESAKKTGEFQQSTDYFTNYVYSLSRGTETKKEDWRAYYYTALSLVRNEIISQREGNAPKIDETSALAEKYIAGIFVKNPNNAEANILLSQINLLKSLNNPTGGAAYLAKAKEYLAKAEAEDKSNPRIDVIKGEIALNSPVKNGGDQELAKKYFNSALAKFKTYSKKSNLDPSWGKEDTNYYLSILK